MFYYTASKEPKLEVSIVQNYTEADLERVFLFIEAFVESPKMKVTFKVHPSVKKQFENAMKSRCLQPLYLYNIKENVA